MNSESLDFILDSIKESVSSVDEEKRDKLIDMILDAKCIFIYGAGRSGLIGQLFAVRLVQIGFNVHFIGDMTTPIIGPDDLTLLISNTGETMSVVQTANIARRLGCKVASVTSKDSNKLAHASNLTIAIKCNCDKKTDIAPLGTVFEDSAAIFFDSIVSLIMKKKKITENDMRKRHAIWV